MNLSARVTLALRVIVVSLLVTAPTISFAKLKSVTLRDRQQAACYGDAQRLCGDTIPDVAKTEACMADKKGQVSPKCAEMYDAVD